MAKKPHQDGLAGAIDKCVNFFLGEQHSGLLFCACDNPKLIAAVNRDIIQDCTRNGVEIRSVDFVSENQVDFLPRIKEAANRLHSNRTAETSPRTATTSAQVGLIINNLSLLIKLTDSAVLRDLNFAREFLLDLRIPLLFWLTESYLPELSNKAPDLYLRRSREAVVFPATAQLKIDLAQLETAITAQESLRGKIPDTILKTTLEALKAEQAKLERLMIAAVDDGAVAQGAGAQAVGARGVLVGGDIKESTVITGDDNRVVINTGDSSYDSGEGLDAYLRHIVKSARYLPLRGIERRASDPESGRRQMALARVYIGLDTTDRKPVRENKGRGRGNKSVAEMDPEGKTRPLSALDAVADNRWLVLLGDPGSGKTTFVNHLCLCLAGYNLKQNDVWCKQLPGWPDTDSVPIPVVLRDFVRGLNTADENATPRRLWDHIAQRLSSQKLDAALPALERALEKGRAVLLLDGLDEIASETTRTLVRDIVAAFMARYDKCRYIITCRVLSYQNQKYRFSDVPYFELAPFTDEKIRGFVDAWYAELQRLGEVRADEIPEDMAKRLKMALKRADLKRLASNPLLLTVMAVVHTHKGRLPEARSLLYEEVVEILLYRWDEQKSIRENGAPRLGELFQAANRAEMDLKIVLWRLAFEAHWAGAGNQDTAVGDITEWDLIQALAGLHPHSSKDWAHQVINTIKYRAGLLLEREPGVYSFPHRTFQEYLAGAHLAAQTNFVSTVLGFAENIAYWREVVLLAVGRLYHVGGELDRPLALIDALCPQLKPSEEIADNDWRNAALAGEALLEIGLNRIGDSKRGPELVVRVQKRLADLVRAGALTPTERVAAGNTLSRLGDPRFNKNTWYLPADDMLGFVEIPGGEFTMGSDPKVDKMAQKREQRQHTVELPLYYMARYPVTNAQFAAFCEDDGYKAQGYWREYAHLASHPVVSVTWYDAVAYCDWLSGRLRNWPEPPEPLATLLKEKKWRVRLPSEAEWEKAARGDDGRIYPWGDKAETDRANYYDTGIHATSPVGCFPAGQSPFGCLDMAGNVWEWTRSLWGTDFDEMKYGYPYDPKDGRENEQADKKMLRVLRGGSYFSPVNFMRCADRGRDDPVSGFNNIGFRVMLSPG